MLSVRFAIKYTPKSEPLLRLLDVDLNRHMSHYNMTIGHCFCDVIHVFVLIISISEII